jgi:hypothetical protein
MCAIEFVSATRTEIAETLEKVEFFFQCEISGAADDRFSCALNHFTMSQTVTDLVFCSDSTTQNQY